MIHLKKRKCNYNINLRKRKTYKLVSIVLKVASQFYYKAFTRNYFEKQFTKTYHTNDDKTLRLMLAKNYDFIDQMVCT